MGMFTYNPNIPNPPDNPSFDVTLMQQNAKSISSLINIEHQGFNTTSNVGGFHKTVTFVAPVSTLPLAPQQIEIYPQLPNIPSGSPTNLENFVSTTNSGGQQLNGYLPMVKFLGSVISVGATGVITNLPAQAGQQIVNFGTVTQSADGKTITVNFAQPLFSSYYAFQTIDSQLPGSITLASGTSSLVITSVAVIVAGKGIRLMVI